MSKGSPAPWFRKSRKSWFVTFNGRQINLETDDRKEKFGAGGVDQEDSGVGTQGRSAGELRGGGGCSTRAIRARFAEVAIDQEPDPSVALRQAKCDDGRVGIQYRPAKDSSSHRRPHHSRRRSWASLVAGLISSLRGRASCGRRERLRGAQSRQRNRSSRWNAGQ